MFDKFVNFKKHTQLQMHRMLRLQCATFCLRVWDLCNFNKSTTTTITRLIPSEVESIQQPFGAREVRNIWARLEPPVGPQPSNGHEWALEPAKLRFATTYRQHLFVELNPILALPEPGEAT